MFTPASTSVLQRAQYLRKFRPVKPDALVRTAPSPQNALDAVPDAWASKFPAPFSDLRAGVAPLFEDERMTWAFKRLGGLSGQNVLELGPLEGGHSYMAHHAGAAQVVAVEMNSKAFLKCLVTKQLFKLDRCHFLAGDALAYMEETNEQFDLCIACGILYHMVDPIRMLDLVSRRSDRTIIWTHFYDRAGIAGNHRLARRLGQAERRSYNGFEYHVHRHSYGLDTRLAGFCGGTEPYSYWLSREDILRAIEHFGWGHVETSFEEIHNPNGPCFDVVASKNKLPAAA
jgi:hypothetical protein